MKEVEDEASKAGKVYVDRILLLLLSVCIYIIIGEIIIIYCDEGNGRGSQCHLYPGNTRNR